MLIGYGDAFTTNEIVKHLWPSLSWQQITSRHWRDARLAAQRVGMVRADGGGKDARGRSRKRTRPIRWIAKPDLS
jgi:hypothetical protein